MISSGMTEKYFQLKTLSPIYKPKLERLTNSQYWVNKNWNISSHLKTESLINKEFEKEINAIKFKQAYNKDLSEDSKNDDKADPLQVKSFL